MRIMSQEAFNHMIEWLRLQHIWLDKGEVELFLEEYAKEFSLKYTEEK